MTPFDRFAEFLASLSFDFYFWGLVKILLLIGIGLYVAFAVIVVRQVNLMIKALNVEFETFLRLVSWLHLLAVVGFFFLALVIL